MSSEGKFYAVGRRKSFRNTEYHGLDSGVTPSSKDAVAHTVTSNTGLFNSRTILTGGTFRFKFPTPGTYSYFCTFHPSMTATVVVN
jgi:hypothetical protein